MLVKGVPLVLAVLFGSQVPDTVPRTRGVDFSGVQQFFAIGDILSRDARPSAGQWRALFATNGYRLAARAVPTLRDDIDLALRPARHAEFIRVTSGLGDHASAVTHIALAYARRADLMAYEDSLTRGAPVADAVALAARFLPPGATRGAAPPLVAFAIFRDDGHSYSDGIVVDLLYASILARGGESLTTILAHEFHHFFVHRLSKSTASDASPEARFADALFALRDEGLADLIDKPYPFHSPDPGLAQYSRQYNFEYARTPEVMRDLDSLLAAVESHPASLPGTGQSLFWSNGHPNGAYIGREILETFGVDSLYPSAHSPAAFLLTFASAERAHGRKAPFSARALRGLQILETRYWK